MDIISYEVDGKEYVMMNKVIIDNTTYLFLINEANPDDLLLRKIVNGNDDELVPLEDEKEVSKVLEFYAK